MKIMLAAILTLAMIVIGLCIYKTRNEKVAIAKTVSITLFLGMFIVLCNLVTLWTRYEVVCLVGYSGYFIASDWMIYYLLRFSLEYVGNQFENKTGRIFLISVLVADSLFVFFNNIWGYMYSLNPMKLFGGESYYELNVTSMFYIHYLIVFLLVVFCVVVLFYRSFTAPKFYRKKYLAIALITTILAVMNIFTVNAAVDISVIGYVVEAVSIYYCVFVYTPQKLLQKTLYRITQDMSVGLYVLDADGKELYCNTCAEAILSIKDSYRNEEGVTLKEWCYRQYTNGTTNLQEERSFFRRGEEFVFRLQLHRIIDKKRQLQAGYFMIQDRTKEINEMKRERYLATHDNLTGVYNKDYFYEKVNEYLEKYPETEFLVICTDIKEFKIINDSFGTKTGDIVLKNAAYILSKGIEGTMACGRIGNDVFAVLMAKDRFMEESFLEIRSEEYQKGTENNIAFPVITHIGVYEVKERDVPVSVMCDRARMAIQEIKHDYLKRIAYYDEKVRENIIREQELVQGLERALAEGQIRIFLQPQTTVDGKLLGAEALVRWEHPEKGWIGPGEFIPVFEKNGLICDVDRYVWEMACKQLKKWKEMGREDIYISVNISPRDFYFLNVYRTFTELVERYDIAPKNLKLEITETAIVMDLHRQMELINRLRKNGFVVEMDDFGSGYSSLNMLKDIHVDILKIDMAFLKKASDEERSKKILQMVIGLSKQLGMPVITEGVESEDQVKFLSGIGCEMFQGYYFAKPMSTEEFERQYL